MDASQGPQLIWGVVMLVLVTSSLFAQRMPIGQFLRYAVIWAAIFAGIYGLVLFRNELGEVWARAKADLTGQVAAEVHGSTTRIRQSDDGHFRVVANVEGREFEFLIDSGATSSFLSDQAAGDLAKLDAKQGLPIVVQTANGPINSWPVDVAGITVGSVRMEPFQMNVSDGGADVNILGMNWLNRLKSWRVERGVMTIEP